jgi:hypothetical protein
MLCSQYHASCTLPFCPLAEEKALLVEPALTKMAEEVQQRLPSYLGRIQAEVESAARSVASLQQELAVAKSSGLSGVEKVARCREITAKLAAASEAQAAGAAEHTAATPPAMQALRDAEAADMRVLRECQAELDGAGAERARAQARGDKLHEEAQVDVDRGDFDSAEAKYAELERLKVEAAAAEVAAGHTKTDLVAAAIAKCRKTRNARTPQGGEEVEGTPCTSM